MLRVFSILILMILSMPVKSSAGDQIGGFVGLASGDRLEVRFTSEGCFHFYACDLTFTRTGHAAVSIAAVQPRWEGAGKTYRYSERSELSRLSLSETDLKGLDALLSFYRTNTISGCTTRNSIKISQIHDGTAIATEKFTDASCSVEDGSVKGVLSIDALIRRVLKEKDRK